MILFVSQSLGSFVSPTCASKSLSQLGGSHGSLPSTVYCRAGRTNLLLSEFWGIKTFFFGPLSQRTLCEAARTGAAVATVVMRSSDPTYQTVPWTWKLVGMGSPSGSPPHPTPDMEPQESCKHTHCWSLRSLLWCSKSGAVSLLHALTSSCTSPSELWPQV